MPLNPSLMKLTLFAQPLDFTPTRKFGVTDAIQVTSRTRSQQSPALKLYCRCRVQLDFRESVLTRFLSFSPAGQNEYVTQHKSDGTIVFADHRMSSLTGYFPNEVLNKSAHKYMVEEDRPVAVFALGRSE